jgi:hypothetical protein
MVCLHPPRDSREQGAVAERDDDGVERFQPTRELHSDRARALGDLPVPPVLDQPRAGLRREALRRFVGLVHDLADLPHVPPERPHALDLQRVRADPREDGQRQPSLSRRPGHALAEIAGRRADEMRFSFERRRQELRAARLERADRVHRLDLDHEAAAELPAE